MINYKEYNYPNFTVYYLTINGRQFGDVLFSLAEVMKCIEMYKASVECTVE